MSFRYLQLVISIHGTSFVFQCTVMFASAREHVLKLITYENFNRPWEYIFSLIVARSGRAFSLSTIPPMYEI